MNTITRTILGLLGGLGLGILGVVALIALLVVVDRAQAHEPDVTLVREAPAQSMNYQSSDQVPPTYLLEDSYVVMEVLPEVPEATCEAWNQSLYARAQLIAKYIAADPEHGYFFKDVLLQLHSMWCIP